ncbi:MAG: TonB family protein, partial [Pseudomonadota bacterium]
MSRGVIEAAVFVALALVLHLGIWWRMPSGTPAASGDGGEAVISMAAVTPQMMEMIEAFETPPEPVEAASTAAILSPVAPPPEIAAPPPTADAPERAVALELPELNLPGVDLPNLQAPPPPPVPPEAAVAPPLDPRAAAPVAEGAPTLPDPVPPDPAPRDPPERALLTPPPGPAVPFEPPPPPPEPDAAPETAAATSPRPASRPDRPAPPPAAQEPRVASAAPPAQEAVPSNRNQAGQAEQRAAGSGAGQAAGTAGRSEVASLSSARREDLLASWGSRIRSRVERRKSHPRGVQGTGTATVRLIVTTDGRLAGLALAGSSGIAAFDEAALNAVRRAGR